LVTPVAADELDGVEAEVRLGGELAVFSQGAERVHPGVCRRHQGLGGRVDGPRAGLERAHKKVLEGGVVLRGADHLVQVHAITTGVPADDVFGEPHPGHGPLKLGAEALGHDREKADDEGVVHNFGA
jgi:hypothetical protein